MRAAYVALWMVLSTAPLTAETRACQPPTVSSYSCSTCARLGGWVAEGFGSPYDALQKFSALTPDQQESAQIVTLSRSRTHVVVWRSSESDRAERAGRLHEIVVNVFHASLPNPLLGALTNYSIDYSGGWDVAVVSTNDPDAPALMIERILADCGGAGRGAGRR